MNDFHICISVFSLMQTVSYLAYESVLFKYQLCETG